MRKKTNRNNDILEMLTENNKIEVAELAEKLGVSQVTMRKDLDELEQKGIIKREHGFAVLSNTDYLGTRIAYHYEEKKKIAIRASQLVHNGDTIMIENGSCCALLAETLTQTHRDLTIITNSTFIANYIRGKSGFQTILLGGIYQPDSQVCVGPLVAQSAENFCVNLFFIGADGFIPKNGFTNRDQMRAQAVRDMSKQAEFVIVLTESEKFLQRGTVPLSLGAKVSHVITDSDLPDESAIALRNLGVNILTVE